MNIFIEEIGTTNNSTVSQLFVDHRALCFTIEDGWRERKVQDETRIPAGRYRIRKRKEGTFFNKYKKQFGHSWVPHIQNVPGFEYILIHIGNTPKDTSGCILVNRCIGINTTTGDYEGTDSTSVYKLLYSLMDKAFERGEEIWIEIQRREVLDLTKEFG